MYVLHDIKPSYMVKALIQILRTEPGRVSDGNYEEYCFTV